MRRRLTLLVVSLVIAVGLGALWFSTNRPVTVELAAVETGPAVELVYATGYVDATHPVSVSARVTAPVNKVLVREGDRVSVGQPLLVQDNAEQLSLLAQAEAQAQAATLTEQRITALFAQGWSTRSARDEAVANGQAARASVAALKARLDQLTVRAGISGIVLKRDVEPGDLAMPAKELMQLGDPAEARVTATVDERDIPRVVTGQTVLMSSDALPGRTVRGHVTEITPGGDPNQRAFRVRIGFDPGENLPFGLTLEVNIIVQRHENALLVPTAAVSEGHAWLVVDGRASKREVKTGIAGTEKIEILSGLAVGDKVIVSPPDDLEDGDRVRP